MFDTGPAGFTGGMNARKYVALAGGSKATATRDLRHLVSASAPSSPTEADAAPDSTCRPPERAPRIARGLKGRNIPAQGKARVLGEQGTQRLDHAKLHPSSPSPRPDKTSPSHPRACPGIAKQRPGRDFPLPRPSRNRHSTR